MQRNSTLNFIKTLNSLLISSYRKNSKNWDTITKIVIVVKVERYGCTLPECFQKGGNGIANGVDPDQTAPSVLGLHCLL